MKKIVILLVCLSAFISCKKETKERKTTADSPEKMAKQTNELTLLKGDFVYYGDAAVLQTHTDIYGVFITDKMLELNTQAEPYKTAPTDMVQVEIRGKISTQKDDKILWDNKVEIIEILNVSAPNPEDNNIVKLGKE